MREETRTRRSHEAEIEVKIRRWSLKKSHGSVIETGKRCVSSASNQKKMKKKKELRAGLVRPRPKVLFLYNSSTFFIYIHLIETRKWYIILSC